MSSVSIAGDTSGSILLAAPAVAGSSTLTLPTTGGTVLANTTPGAILQVIWVQTATQATNSTTTYASTNLTANITPRSSSNKILVIPNIAGIYNGSGNSEGTTLRINRNGAVVFKWAAYVNYISSAVAVLSTSGTTWLDSPTTTSAVTYTVEFAKSDGNGSYSGVQWNGDISSMTLMEIAA